MRIWLVTLGSHGDVHPFVGLARRLMARGHQATLLAVDHFESLAAEAGVPFVRVGEPGVYDRLAGNAEMWHARRGGPTVLKLAVSSIDPIFEALDANAQDGDVVVASMLAIGARVFRDARPVKLVTAHLQPMALRGLEDPCLVPGMPNLRWLWPAMRKRIWRGADVYYLDRILAGGINDVRARHDLPPVNRVMHKWWHSPDDVIGFWPDWFSHVNLGWPENITLCGFPLYDESDFTPELPADLQTFLQAGPPPIAFTPGSAMKFGGPFFQAAADACQQLGRPGLLLTRHPEQLPAHLPPGVIHVPFAPFSRLLPHVAALVHHGGIGTMSQAFKAGVPQLVMPMAHDQFDNAARAMRLGVADVLPRPKFTPRRLIAKLNGLLTRPGVPIACKRVQRLSTGDDALGAACDVVENVQRVDRENDKWVRQA